MDFREHPTGEVRSMENLHLARAWDAAMFQNPSFLVQQLNGILGDSRKFTGTEFYEVHIKLSFSCSHPILNSPAMLRPSVNLQG
jgi:hypothetical protein